MFLHCMTDPSLVENNTGAYVWQSPAESVLFQISMSRVVGLLFLFLIVLAKHSALLWSWTCAQQA